MYNRRKLDKEGGVKVTSIGMQVTSGKANPSISQVAGIGVQGTTAGSAFREILAVLVLQQQSVHSADGTIGTPIDFLAPQMEAEEVESLTDPINLSGEQWVQLEKLLQVVINTYPQGQTVGAMSDEQTAEFKQVIERLAAWMAETKMTNEFLKEVKDRPNQTQPVASQLGSLLRGLMELEDIPTVLKEQIPKATRMLESFEPAIHPQAERAVGLGQGEEAAATGHELRQEPIRIGHHQLSNPVFIHQSSTIIPKTMEPVTQWVRADQFVSDMNSLLLSKMNITKMDGVSQAKLSLFPEQMGQLDVRISIQQGQVTAQFIVETAVAREMLESNLTGLRNILVQQGLQVDKLDVFLADESAGAFNQEQPKEGSQSQQQRHNRQVLDQSSNMHIPNEEIQSDSIQAYGYLPTSSFKNIDFTA
jgi:hypothetical protein